MKSLLILLALTFSMGFGSISLAKTKSDVPLHLWVWTPNVVLDPVAQNDFFEFVEDHSIQKIFLHDTYLTTKHTANLQRFFDRAAGIGLKIELLLGNPEWIFPDQHDVALKYIRRSIDFLMKQKENGFPTLHLNIEPMTLEDFWSGGHQELYLQWFFDLLEKIHNEAPPGGLALSIDINAWYDEWKVDVLGSERVLSEAIIDLADSITIMAFRDDGEDSFDIAKSEIEYASELKKNIIIGLETQCGVAPRHISFCGRKRSAITKAIAKIDKLTEKHPTFRGVAIHNYTSFSSFGRKRTPQAVLDQAQESYIAEAHSEE